MGRASSHFQGGLSFDMRVENESSVCTAIFFYKIFSICTSCWCGFEMI